MLMLRLTMTVAIYGTIAAGALAEVPSGSGARWAVLASSQSLDDAIGIASMYEWRFDHVRVVESSNGWLAVVAGPVPIPDGIKAAKQALVAQGGLPKDLFMSNGAEFQQTLWQPERRTFPTWSADSNSATRFETSGIEAILDTVPAENAMNSPRLTGTQSGKPAFSSVMSAVETSRGKSAAVLVPLDPESSDPEVVFSAYWDGAHCCTVTEIFSLVNDHWARTEASTLDGGGYEFQDLDGDGSMELLSHDNSFLYAFASYSESWSPKVVEQLRGGVLTNQSRNANFAIYYRRELAGVEHLAKHNPSLWHSNGFLAAWVARKALLGEFDDAWPRMMASFDRSSDWSMMVCSQRRKLSDCPESARVTATFPEALRFHLEEHGYLQSDTPGNVAVAPVSPDQEDKGGPDRRQPHGEKSETGSSGTGFFVTAGGAILTNFHVIDGCGTVFVLHGRSPSTTATVVARDETNDLALLRIEKQVDHFAKFNVRTRLGEPVAAFGFPLSSILSSGGNFTLGNVTALSGLRDDSRYLQTSAPVQPGNSGGPLVDYYGNVAGIVTGKFNAVAAMVATGDIVQNVNFAIRSSTVVSFLLANGVDVAFAKEMPGEDRLEPPDLADYVTTISVAVRCQ